MAERGYWARFDSARVSRRRVLATTGTGAAGLLLAAACGGGSGGTKTSVPAGTREPAGTPKSGGRYRGDVAGDWGTIDPVTSVGNATGILPRLYNTLISKSNPQPDFIFYDLAQSFEQPDDATFIFKIRPGVKIGPNSLGVPERAMDALDVQKWVERIRTDKNALGRAFTEPFLESSEALNDTFTMKTKGPYSYFLVRIGRALGGCIPPREFFEQNISLRDQGVGGGPFIIKPGSYQESGGVSMERNPNYYRTDEKTGIRLPFMDAIDVVRISDRQARRTAFLDKQIYSYGASTIDEANELIRQKGDLHMLRSAVFTFISWSMNPTRDPWKDDRIRQAALHALDRKQFIDLIFGEGEAKADGLVHWPTGPYAFDENELEQFQSYDPKKSRELIRAATGQDSIKVKITYPVSDIEFHDKHLPIFLKQVREAGFDVEEEPKDFTSWLGDYTKVNYDSSLSLNQIYETPEIALDWHSSKGPQGDGNFAVGVGTIYPEVDEAILNSKRAVSPQDHVDRVRAAQRLVYEKGPAFLPIISWYSYTLLWNFVKDSPENFGDTGTFLNTAWLDL
jgi:peptide/nickel transport system substrate-binding protein